MRLAYRDLIGRALISGACAVAFALIIRPQFGPKMVWTWLGAMIAFTIYRLWLAIAFQREVPVAADFPRWSRRCLITTTLSGVGWGLSIWLFPTLDFNPQLGIFHVIVLTGLTAGASRMLLPTRHGSTAYVVAVLGPLAAWFFAENDAAGALLGGSIALLIIYVGLAALRSHETLAEALAMRFERETLAEELQAETAMRETREGELRDARERAESANRAKADFLATISHEIRTPMNGVLGMLRIVRDTALTAEQRDYLKTASDSAETLLLLLNDVLDFSKIEAGRLELQSAPFPPVTSVRAVADLMHTRARDKGLHFELHLGENLPGAIVGDAARVRQILVALIGNAIKFTEKGNVTLDVACAERTDTKAVLHFTVTDTGIGIDSGALERLFKPFTQADTSMGRRYGGTGLGLAISARLAKAMDGLLQVQSTLNKGTTFRLILPCQLPEAFTPPPPDEPRFSTPTLKGRVLVVEDDTVNRQVMELFLKKMRVTPKFAPDGDVAIKLATTETFDVILMDCQLPGIDGMETTRRIRKKLEGGRPVKIIALTANAGRNVRDACLEAGMDDFLTKPVRLELLADALQRNLPKG